MALRSDPSGTGFLTRRFCTEILRRLALLARDVRVKVVTEDSFGLEGTPKQPPSTPWEPYGDAPKGSTADSLGLKSGRSWAVLSGSDKMIAFDSWFSDRVEEEFRGKWARSLVLAAYMKGAGRAFIELRKLDSKPESLAGGVQHFVRSFADLDSIDRVNLLFARTLEDLKGLSQKIVTDLNRVLAETLISTMTTNAKKDKTELNSKMQKKLKAARVAARRISRTEMVRAHAEGQLDAFEDLGVEKVGAYAEWLTAQDTEVCPACDALEGVQFTLQEARGLIPRHPNCRCCWLPSEIGTKARNQRKRDLETAVGSSIIAEVGKYLRDEGKVLASKMVRLKIAKDLSSWKGKKLLRTLRKKRKK